MKPILSLTLAELLTNRDQTIYRNSMAIMKQLNRKKQNQIKQESQAWLQGKKKQSSHH